MNFAIDDRNRVHQVPVERIVPISKRVVCRIEKVVDVPVHVSREPEVQTDQGLIPLSQWELLNQGTIEYGLHEES